MVSNRAKSTPSSGVRMSNAFDSGKWRCHFKHKEQKEAERFQWQGLWPTNTIQTNTSTKPSMQYTSPKTTMTMEEQPWMKMYVLFKNGDSLYLLPCYFEGYFETHLPQPSPPTPTVRLVLGKSHPSKGTTPQGAHPWLHEFFSTTFLAQKPVRSRVSFLHL